MDEGFLMQEDAKDCCLQNDIKILKAKKAKSEHDADEHVTDKEAASRKKV